MKKILVFVGFFMVSSLSYASEDAIVFKIPQAIITEPLLNERLPSFNSINKKIVYSLNINELSKMKKFVKTKIGTLGLITTMVDTKNNAIGIHYISLTNSEPQVTLYLPEEIKSNIKAKNLSLSLNIFSGKSGPSMVNINLGLKNGKNLGPISLKVDGNAWVLIPLSMFNIKKLDSLTSIRLTIPRSGDKDGIGTCYFGNIKIVKNTQ
jgi:hypothetical protein